MEGDEDSSNKGGGVPQSSNTSGASEEGKGVGASEERDKSEERDVGELPDQVTEVIAVGKERWEGGWTVTERVNFFTDPTWTEGVGVLQVRCVLVRGGGIVMGGEDTVLGT